jgi:peptide/nickel transport system substrate-binding protein
MRPTNWPGRQEVTGRRSRFVGLLFTAVLLAFFFIYYFSTRAPGGGSAPGSVLSRDTGSASPAAGARRGGQIVGSIRGEPRTFNRLVARDQTVDTLAWLMHGKLLRTNRQTFELEPWLAERWESSADGLRHTLHLRQGLTWSDGTPFTSADVLFTLRAAHDPKVQSVFAGTLTAGGKPIRAEAPDAATVVLTFAGPFGPGVRILDALPILPRHKLEASLDAGTFARAWSPTTPPAEIVGMGPFVLREYAPGQRLVFDRNERYWRKSQAGEGLPYLDRIVLELVADQNTELLRLTSGAIDLTHTELRQEDFVPARRAEKEGRIRLVELGVGPDADAFWFCMKPELKQKDPRFAFVQKREFRQAISHAVDREAFAETVFLGEAVPVWGPITPGNRLWFSPNVPRYPHDLAKARELLKSIGLEDRNGNGVVEDAAGTEARFTVVTQRGVTYYERGTQVLREHAAKAGIALDIAPLEAGTLFERIEACNFDAAYMRPLFSDIDPAGNMDFWLSSGQAHYWNMSQSKPATEWEARMDTLMAEQARTIDPARRRELFDQVQTLFAENVPVLYFAAPRLFYGHSARLTGVSPSVLRPALLWSADTLAVAQ